MPTPAAPSHPVNALPPKFQRVGVGLSIKRRDTPEARAFWDFVERTSREVAEECRRSGWKEDPVTAEQRGGPGGYEYPDSRWTQ